MAASAVVEDLDILKQRPPRRLFGHKAGVMDQLVLQAAEEALHWGVVIAVTPPAHRAADLVAIEDRLVIRAGILHATDALLFVKLRSAVG